MIKNIDSWRSRQWDERTDADPVYSRKVLMRRIDEKLKEYGKRLNLSAFDTQSTFVSLKSAPDELVSRIRTYVSLDRPNSRIIRNVQSVRNWIKDHRPLVNQESWILHHRDDLVSLSDGQEYGWIDAVVEDFLSSRILPRNLINV